MSNTNTIVDPWMNLQGKVRTRAFYGDTLKGFFFLAAAMSILEGAGLSALLGH